MQKSAISKYFLCTFLFCIAVVSGQAQTFINVLSFDGADGAGPYYMSLVQGIDGNFYGTTSLGGNVRCSGSSSCGTAFRITPTGTLTTLYYFCSQQECTDGYYPSVGLVLATDGNFYGTTIEGGTGGTLGTVFRITPAGVLTTMHNFEGPDGAGPLGALIQAVDGNLYGTSYVGGANGYGTVFKMSLTGTITTLYNFCAQANCADGADPSGPLVQAGNGSLYGTTTGGGVNTDSYGTVFKITTSGKFTSLHSFTGRDGSNPYAGLLLGSDGKFYGTTQNRGMKGGGTVFRMTPGGKLTTAYAFQKGAGASTATLLQGTDGDLYGTTSMGGANVPGTIFSIDSTGTLTILHTFDFEDGSFPSGGLFQSTDGTFYGTAYAGGVSNAGTVYSLNTGLAPFVAFIRNSARIGQSFGVLGQGFSGTTSVSLNGTPVNFKVISDTFIRAAVPVGATTGYVTVAMPSGTLTSNVPFHVLP